MASPGWRAVAAATALVAATLGAYRGVAGNDFVVYDDDQYVTANPALRDGLTAPAIRWAFVTDHAANWHPLTWLSHLLDVQLFGFAPRGHHLMSLALHVAATVLLFLLLRRLTGNALPSLATAALFGLHPAHVESVAWVAERKDVLSTLLGLFAIAAYAGWVRRPSWRRYAALVGLFALGLLAKPMLVTLPFVLLLLDLWPLRRWSWKESLAGLVPRVREKLPLFALAAASCSVTFLVQRGGGAVQSADRYPLAIRCQNAAVAYVDYLRQLAWPSDLAVFYPHPGVALSPLRALASLALLLLLTAGAWRLRRSQPAVLVGWLWFLGTLLPVIGLVQVGWQARADRYTYLPSIGLFVALAWGAGALATTPERRTALAAATGAALAACCFVTQAQVGYWRDSETLFLRALAVTRENFLAENNLGHFYNERSRPAEALPICRKRSASGRATAKRTPTWGERSSSWGASTKPARSSSARTRFSPAIPWRSTTWPSRACGRGAGASRALVSPRPRAGSGLGGAEPPDGRAPAARGTPRGGAAPPRPRGRPRSRQSGLPRAAGRRRGAIRRRSSRCDGNWARSTARSLSRCCASGDRQPRGITMRGRSRSTRPTPSRSTTSAICCYSTGGGTRRSRGSRPPSGCGRTSRSRATTWPTPCGRGRRRRGFPEARPIAVAGGERGRPRRRRPSPAVACGRRARLSPPATGRAPNREPGW